MSKALKFRRLKKSDWSDMFEYGSNPNVTKFVSWNIYKNHDDAKIANKQLRSKRDHHLFAILVYGKMVGTCSLEKINNIKKTVEVGMVLNEEFWDMGIGTSAVTHLMNVSHIFYKGYKILSKTHAKDISFQKLLLKCGFVEDKRKSNSKFKYYFFKI